MKILTDTQIARKIPPQAALRLAEAAFLAWGQKRVQMPPKVYLTLPEGDFRAMPAYIRTTGVGGGVVGVKWISVYPGNIKKGFKAVNGTLLLSDASTGRLKAVMEANVLTALRTGAAGALATRFLANPDASRLLLVGSGVQSAYQLACHKLLKKWSTIRVWAPDPRQAERFAREHRIEAARSLEAAVRDSDVISSCTPSRKPLILSDWVSPGTHINAIGADAPGKQELQIALLKRSRVVVDDWVQASHSGEINVAHTRGLFFKKSVTGDLGTLLAAKRKVRRSAADVTIFDSTGLAVQDMMMADYAVR